MWKYEVRHLVINYGVTMKKRATRYEHAKACHVIMSRDRRDAKSHVIRISTLLTQIPIFYRNVKFPAMFSATLRYNLYACRLYHSISIGLKTSLRRF